MKRFHAVLLRALLLCAFLPAAYATVFTWTGIGTGWKGQIAPTGNGPEDLVFGRNVNPVITLPGTAYNSLTFTKDDDFYFTPASPIVFTLANGISFTSASSFGSANFSSNITLNLAQTQIWNAGTNLIRVSGKISGSGPLTLRVSMDANGESGFFVFNNQSPINNYTGGTTLDLVGANNRGGVAFWNSTPFGSGPVTITNGAWFSAHNPGLLSNYTVANNFTVTSSSTNPWTLRNWDTPLYLSGTITLAANAFITAKHAFANLPGPNNDGRDPLPGPLTRYPTIITGQIGETGGSRSLTVGGQGILILSPASGSNTYTGGTIANGSLIFGNNNAAPAGTGNVIVNNSGYVGFGDISTGNFATQRAHINKASSGAIGVDTLPGNATVTLSDAIDLSSFTNAGIRLGTATSAVLTGALTPQGTNYQFGNGGGTLFVQSNLGNVTNPITNPSLVASSVVLNNDSPVPLKLYLQGNNTYTGVTSTGSGIIVFDGANAIPTNNSLNASGSSSLVGQGYIGYTDSVGITPSTFLSKFNQTTTFGIIGFDTHAGSPAVTINGVDLTGFNDGVYLGTTSRALITGTLTPSTGHNTNQTANTLRFTAANGGTLTVASTLADNGNGALGVVIGSPSATNAFSDGTVLLNGNNTYTGGTLLNTNGGTTLALGNNSALGSGNLNIAPNSGVVSIVGLQANAIGLVIPNNLVFQTPDYINNGPAQLALIGSNNFTLAGKISSGPLNTHDAPADILLYNATPLTVTLSGDNSGYFGNIEVVNGTLNLAHNNAAGRGALHLNSANATVAYSNGVLAPILYGIHGDAGSLVLPTGANLTVNTDNVSNTFSDSEFGGVISGSASLTVTGTVNPSKDANALFLYGKNTYTGGTTINGQTVFALGNNNAAGTGPITINASSGGLAINSNVTLANPLVFNTGGLAGLGTFNPSNVSGTGQTTGKITFGANQIIFPGIPGQHQIPGRLTFGTSVALANGGSFHLSIQDPANVEGYGSLDITGNLDLTALTAGAFTLKIESLDLSGLENFASTIVWGNSYSLPIIVVTGGSILGFNAANFALNVSQFQNGQIPLSAFHLSTDATNKTLFLNFTAVPEPSTWALLVSGAGFIGLLALRRRRA